MFLFLPILLQNILTNKSSKQCLLIWPKYLFTQPKMEQKPSCKLQIFLVTKLFFRNVNIWANSDLTVQIVTVILYRNHTNATLHYEITRVYHYINKPNLIENTVYIHNGSSYPIPSKFQFPKLIFLVSRPNKHFNPPDPNSTMVYIYTRTCTNHTAVNEGLFPSFRVSSLLVVDNDIVSLPGMAARCFPIRCTIGCDPTRLCSEYIQEVSCFCTHQLHWSC